MSGGLPAITIFRVTCCVRYAWWTTRSYNVQDDLLCKICLVDYPLSHMVKLDECGCMFCREVSLPKENPHMLPIPVLWNKIHYIWNWIKKFGTICVRIRAVSQRYIM